MEHRVGHKESTKVIRGGQECAPTDGVQKGSLSVRGAGSPGAEGTLRRPRLSAELNSLSDPASETLLTLWERPVYLSRYYSGFRVPTAT